MFPRRHDWFNHERQHHRVQWLCSFCAEGPYISENKFQNHLRAQHSDNFIDSQLPILVSDGKRPMEQLPADCPFCDDFEKLTRLSNPQVSSNEILTIPWVVFRNHVGRHMKDLSTFAIPRGEDEDDQDTIASGDSAKVAVAIADADLLQKELAPRKVTTSAGSQGSDVESIVASETGMGEAEDVVLVPDAAENCFIGQDGLPQGMQPLIVFCNLNLLLSSWTLLFQVAGYRCTTCRTIPVLDGKESRVFSTRTSWR